MAAFGQKDSSLQSTDSSRMDTPDKVAACSIAGSDSGGGAGIQADLKTFDVLGVWGCTVVTAVTAQNTKAVLGSWPLSPRVVRCQLEAVLDDFPIRACKTGMLANAGIIRTVAGVLADGPPLVVDPVMVATSGGRLLDTGAESAMTRLLLPVAALVTPNIPEALVLSGLEEIAGIAAMEEAGRAIRELGAGAVLVKGGHLPGGCAVDVLVDGEGVAVLEGERLPWQVHGSGCCLSAAIAAYLALGHPLRWSCSAAKEFVTAAIRSAVPAKSGTRMVNPAWKSFPECYHPE